MDYRVTNSENMAERVGFEPTLEFPLNTLSKRAPSTTRPSLRIEFLGSDCGRTQFTPTLTLNRIFRDAAMDRPGPARAAQGCLPARSVHYYCSPLKLWPRPGERAEQHPCPPALCLPSALPP